MLDPQRVGLNAASVGFLARTKQNVDWGSFNQALQTDDSRVADVRATVETPVDELHVMGGERFGLESNSNLKMNARQERQINGYPLRSFSAEAPAIILPDKYGGLPLYTRNQSEYSDFVSRYTAPLSYALQNDTVLLGRQGYAVTNESASQPFVDVGFEHNLHKSKDAIDYNEAAIRQRQWLQYQSHVAHKQKRGEKVTHMRMSSANGRGVKNSIDGIFIGADGRPMTQVNSDSLGDMAYGAYTQRTGFNPQNAFLAGTNQLSASSDRLNYNSRKPGLDPNSIQARANEIINRIALQNRQRASRAIVNTELGDMYLPEHAQQNFDITVGNANGLNTPNPSRRRSNSLSSLPITPESIGSLKGLYYRKEALKSPAGSRQEKVYNLKARLEQLAPYNTRAVAEKTKITPRKTRGGGTY